MSVTPRPVAPDAVHVWRGFLAPHKDYAEFAKFLGSVFLPACALLQPNAGLHAYLPAMPRRDGKPAGVPDQTALMFWTNQQAYHDAFETVAVRAYTNLHGDAYDTTKSSAEFPVALGDGLEAGTPVYLVDAPADWMLGRVRHLVAAPAAGQEPAAFLAAVSTWATQVRDQRPAGLQGGLLCATETYVVAWLLWDPAVKIATDPLDELARQSSPWLDTTADTYELPAGLWDRWPGIDLGDGASCLNIQLERPAQEVGG